VQGNPKGVILSHAAVNANASTADIVYNVRQLNSGGTLQPAELILLSVASVF
jgi:long-subunit acyl-CoA synthetase (AMP-forming)